MDKNKDILLKGLISQNDSTILDSIKKVKKNGKPNHLPILFEILNRPFKYDHNLCAVMMRINTRLRLIIESVRRVYLVAIPQTRAI